MHEDARGWQIPALSGCTRIAEDGKYPRFQDARGLLGMANTRAASLHEDARGWQKHVPSGFSACFGEDGWDGCPNLYTGDHKNVCYIFGFSCSVL